MSLCIVRPLMIYVPLVWISWCTIKTFIRYSFWRTENTKVILFDRYFIRNFAFLWNRSIASCFGMGIAKQEYQGMRIARDSSEGLKISRNRNFLNKYFERKVKKNVLLKWELEEFPLQGY